MASLFQSRLLLFPVALIVERIGCWQSVVYAWRAGNRVPELWQHVLIEDKLGHLPTDLRPVKRGRLRKATATAPAADGAAGQ
jgi:hypothetical protein